MNVRRLVLRVLLSFVAFVFSGALLHAQTTAEPARTELRFMSWEVGQTGLFVTENDRDFTPITAPAYELGQPVFVRAATPVRIYEQSTNEQGVIYIVVGETGLPAGCRTAHVYLIRRPDRDGRRDYQLIALANDAETFPAGKVRLFNFSPWPGAIQIGGAEMNLPSLEWRVVDAVPDRKNRVTLRAALQLPEGDWTRPVRDLVTLRENYRGSVTLLHTRRSFDETDPESVRSQARLFIQTASEYLNPQPVDNNR